MITLKRIKASVKLMKRSDYHYFRAAMVAPPFWLSANSQKCRILAGENSGAGSCYYEVVVEDCYRMFDYSRKARPRIIVDIGANVGVFSRLCSLLFPEADIYAYEPHPAALPWLERNAESTRIRVVPDAVGEHAGVVSFEISYDSTLGHVSKDGALKVNCIAASEVAEGRPIDLLKMDCEGGEWDILRDPSLLGRTKDFRLEYHLTEGRSLGDLRALLESGGHRVQEIIGVRENGKFGQLPSTSASTAAR